MRDFVARHGLEAMTHVVDADGALWTRFGVAYQPAWVFVAPDGDVEVVAGMLDAELPARLDTFLSR